MRGVRGLESIERQQELRELLERVVVRYRSLAVSMRGYGREREAARLEQFAARTHLRLEEPKATKRMREAAQAVRDAPRFPVLVERALEGALSLAGADFGNVQMRDPVTGALRIVCQYGFSNEFLEYFAVVDDASSACGRAATRRAQSVIVDVDEDPRFAPHRGIAAASGFRAVQSTPLTDPSGRLLGVFSVHFRRRHGSSDGALQLLQWYGDLVGAAIAESSNPGGPETQPTEAATRYSYATDARLHADIAALARAQSNLLHDTAATAHEQAAALHERAVTLSAPGSAAVHRMRAEAARERAEQARRRSADA